MYWQVKISTIYVFQFTSQNLVAIRGSIVIEGIGREIVLVSGYFASDRPSPPSEILDLPENCYMHKLQLILANAHHDVWTNNTNTR